MYSPLRQLSRLLYSYQLGVNAHSMQPNDSPSVRTGDIAADRLLVIGTGPAWGAGVVTHQLALPGQLSRALRMRSRTSCDVDYVGHEVMDLGSTPAWIGSRSLVGYDTVLIILGTNDAARLTPVSDWENELRTLLDRVLRDTRAETPVVVAGVPPLRYYRALHPICRVLGDRHAAKLNSATERISADHERVTYFRLGAARPDNQQRLGSPKMYAEWAEMAAEAVAPALASARNAGRTSARPSTVTPVDAVTDDAWVGTEQAVERSSRGDSPVLQEISDRAREAFGVEYAYVSLKDGDTLWHVNGGKLPQSVPLELSYCQYTVEGGQPFVVPDARNDPRFTGNGLIDLSHLVFYAGIPLQSATGEAIGAFCLLGSRPKNAAVVRSEIFMELAQQAQQELWKLEGEVRRERGVSTDGVAETA